MNAAAVPLFPVFAPITLEHKSAMHPKLSLTVDGVSEFTFAGLYLFRKRYDYKISQLENENIIISGVEPLRPDGSAKNEGKKFFMTPCAAPGRGILSALFKTHDYWKNISDSVLIPKREKFEDAGLVFEEDRDNFDYLYLRTDLAELAGKKYHKKRNLVTQFRKLYSHEERPLTPCLVDDAMEVLEKWKAGRTVDADYFPCREALELFALLPMKGWLCYVDGRPVGLSLGEPVARGRMFSISFEKGLDGYKGIYQFINQAFSAALPEYFTHINREQDMGDEGLRQAKMTYRPSGFVRKYTGRMR